MASKNGNLPKYNIDEKIATINLAHWWVYSEVAFNASKELFFSKDLSNTIRVAVWDNCSGHEPHSDTDEIHPIHKLINRLK